MSISRPQSPEEYIGRATACEQLVASATSPKIRETLLYLASVWRALADEAEAKQQPQPLRRPDTQHSSE